MSAEAVVKEYLTTAADGKNYQTKFYRLEMILAVGYRVRSPRGTQFRRWATNTLREYLIKFPVYERKFGSASSRPSESCPNHSLQYTN